MSRTQRGNICPVVARGSKRLVQGRDAKQSAKCLEVTARCGITFRRNSLPNSDSPSQITQQFFTARSTAVRIQTEKKIVNCNQIEIIIKTQCMGFMLQSCMVKKHLQMKPDQHQIGYTCGSRAHKKLANSCLGLCVAQVAIAVCV